ncbi:hypothetical protein ACFQO7_33030 [Catellatospora aurea]|uniref:DUF4276 family protein n=1 Tax=Catellatospora aurea TaxID=1337874 RepID=A0ABW2H4W5_9ACTN
MRRILFLGEGTSDEGIAVHVERIAEGYGLDVALTVPDLALLPLKDRTVRGKLEAVMTLGASFDLVVVHRDSDNVDRRQREQEIREAVELAVPKCPHVAVVPVKMTEAWLVLDESSIRSVAGNPGGRMPLGLPSPREAERVADPKQVLKEALVTASGLAGRKRTIFQRGFSHQRRQLLERLDHNGAVRHLPSWRTFVTDLQNAFSTLS